MDSSFPVSCNGSSNRKLEGKVAIITGGASGIGEATTCLFVENGASVVIADVQDEKGYQLAKRLGPHVASFKHCDVTVESDVEDLVAFAVQTWGRLDIMFNNAGTLGNDPQANVLNMSAVDFDNVLSINVRGMAFGVKHAGRAMVDAKIKGSIICTASISSFLSGMNLPAPYIVSKHATLGLVRAAAYDLGKYGIRVNCVSPSVIPTHLVMGFVLKAHNSTTMTQEEVQAYFDSNNNLALHSLTCLDVAKGVLYLASDDAAFVSGINHIIDGGYSSGKRLLYKGEL